MSACFGTVCCCNNPLVTLRLAPQGMKSGCTAVCCLVREQSHLYVGWLGDSQAMLARRGVALPLVNPHKPEREVSLSLDCRFYPLLIHDAEF